MFPWNIVKQIGIILRIVHPFRRKKHGKNVYFLDVESLQYTEEVQLAESILLLVVERTKKTWSSDNNTQILIHYRLIL